MHTGESVLDIIILWQFINLLQYRNVLSLSLSLLTDLFLNLPDSFNYYFSLFIFLWVSDTKYNDEYVQEVHNDQGTLNIIIIAMA